MKDNQKKPTGNIAPHISNVTNAHVHMRQRNAEWAWKLFHGETKKLQISSITTSKIHYLSSRVQILRENKNWLKTSSSPVRVPRMRTSKRQDTQRLSDAQMSLPEDPRCSRVPRGYVLVPIEGGQGGDATYSPIDPSWRPPTRLCWSVKVLQFMATPAAPACSALPARHKGCQWFRKAGSEPLHHLLSKPSKGQRCTVSLLAKSAVSQQQLPKDLLQSLAGHPKAPRDCFGGSVEQETQLKVNTALIYWQYQELAFWGFFFLSFNSWSNVTSQVRLTENLFVGRLLYCAVEEIKLQKLAKLVTKTE